MKDGSHPVKIYSPTKRLFGFMITRNWALANIATGRKWFGVFKGKVQAILEHRRQAYNLYQPLIAHDKGERWLPKKSYQQTNAKNYWTS
jgi:hypothetical protein